MLNIKSIIVENLFDYYSYTIEMKQHDRVSIIHAPNGYGKTTVFNLVKYYLDFDIYKIAPIPFDKFELVLSNEAVMRIEKKSGKTNRRKEKENDILIFSIVDSGKKTIKFEIPINDYVLTLVREHSIEDVVFRLERHSRELAEIVGGEEGTFSRENYKKFRSKFMSISEQLNVNYIDSNRLFSSTNQSGRNKVFISYNYKHELMSRELLDDNYESDDNTDEKILIDAKDIRDRIQKARQRYSLESEERDRDFPDRLVASVNSKKDCFSDEIIAEELNRLEQKRLELENAGLVLSGKKTLNPTEKIDNTMRMFYTLYIQDTFEKLSAYDDIKAKLELFIEIINTKTSFSNKRMRIDNERGVVFEPVDSNTGKVHNIPLEKLSSGEKNDFIMFYELIFNSDNTSVFLIDEPEISLHVAWQMQFISILERICELNDSQAIIATHSPDIVNGRDDLLVSLGLEEDFDGK